MPDESTEKEGKRGKGLNIEDYSNELREVISLYAKTKKFIIDAEQTDPESKSNIAVFKEQRDAADHLMRVLSAFYFPNTESTESYVKLHLEKSQAHLYRAAYDSLDGIGLSSKVSLNEAMKGISNEAITAVFPEYWDKVGEFDQLDKSVAAHRCAKDIGRDTLDNLDRYANTVVKLGQLTQLIKSKSRLFHEWEARNEAKEKKTDRKNLKARLVDILVIGVVGAIIGGLGNELLRDPVKNFFSKNSASSTSNAVANAVARVSSNAVPVSRTNSP